MFAEKIQKMFHSIVSNHRRGGDTRADVVRICVSMSPVVIPLVYIDRVFYVLTDAGLILLQKLRLKFAFTVTWNRDFRFGCFPCPYFCNRLQFLAYSRTGGRPFSYLLAAHSRFVRKYFVVVRSSWVVFVVAEMGRRQKKKAYETSCAS